MTNTSSTPQTFVANLGILHRISAWLAFDLGPHPAERAEAGGAWVQILNNNTTHIEWCQLEKAPVEDGSRLVFVRIETWPARRASHA